MSVCEGERRPLRPEVVPQHSVGVGPCGGGAPPSLVRLITTALYPPHNDDGRFESGTPRGQRPVSAMSLLTHPTLSPVLCSLVNEISRCRALSGSAFGSTHEGGATPPACENVDARPVDVVPCGDVAPPRINSHLENGPSATAWSRPKLEERQPMLLTVVALAPTRDCAGVLGRVKVSRAAATMTCRDLDAASARPRDGSCRSEQE